MSFFFPVAQATLRNFLPQSTTPISAPLSTAPSLPPDSISSVDSPPIASLLDSMTSYLTEDQLDGSLSRSSSNTSSRPSARTGSSTGAPSPAMGTGATVKNEPEPQGVSSGDPSFKETRSASSQSGYTVAPASEYSPPFSASTATRISKLRGMPGPSKPPRGSSLSHSAQPSVALSGSLATGDISLPPRLASLDFTVSESGDSGLLLSGMGAVLGCSTPASALDSFPPTHSGSSSTSDAETEKMPVTFPQFRPVLTTSPDSSRRPELLSSDSSGTDESIFIASNQPRVDSGFGSLRTKGSGRNKGKGKLKARIDPNPVTFFGEVVSEQSDRDVGNSGQGMIATDGGEVWFSAPSSPTTAQNTRSTFGQVDLSEALNGNQPGGKWPDSRPSSFPSFSRLIDLPVEFTPQSREASIDLTKSEYSTSLPVRFSAELVRSRSSEPSTSTCSPKDPTSPSRRSSLLLRPSLRRLGKSSLDANSAGRMARPKLRRSGRSRSHSPGTLSALPKLKRTKSQRRYRFTLTGEPSEPRHGGEWNRPVTMPQLSRTLPSPSPSLPQEERDDVFEQPPARVSRDLYLNPGLSKSAPELGIVSPVDSELEGWTIIATGMSPVSVLSHDGVSHTQDLERQRHQTLKAAEDEEVSAPSGKKQRRLGTLLEFVEGEEAYFRDLEMLQEVYLFKLSGHPISDSERLKIQRNVQDLVELQADIVGDISVIKDAMKVALVKGKAIEARIAKASIEVMVDIFTRRKPKFVVYNSFCARHAEAASTIRQLENRLDWDAFEAECSAEVNERVSAAEPSSFPMSTSPSSSSRLRFEDFLIKPVQRICRYPLLFEQLLKNSVDDDEKAGLQQAVEVMKVIAAEVDIAKTTREVEIKTELVRERMQAINMSSRILSDELAKLGTIKLLGTLHILHFHTSDTQLPKVRWLACILYKTHFLMAKIKRAASYELRHCFPLQELEAGDLTENEGLLPFSFRLCRGDDQFEIGATCSQEKVLWYSYLTTAMDEAGPNPSKGSQHLQTLTYSTESGGTPVIDNRVLDEDNTPSSLVVVYPQGVASKNRISQTASSLLGKTPSNERAAVDLKLADVFSDSCLVARDQGASEIADTSRKAHAHRRQRTISGPFKPQELTKPRRKSMAIELEMLRPAPRLPASPVDPTETTPVSDEFNETNSPSATSYKDRSSWGNSLRRSVTSGAFRPVTSDPPKLESARNQGSWRVKVRTLSSTSNVSLEGASLPKTVDGLPGSYPPKHGSAENFEPPSLEDHAISQKRPSSVANMFAPLMRKKSVSSTGIIESQVATESETSFTRRPVSSAGSQTIPEAEWFAAGKPHARSRTVPSTPSSYSPILAPVTFPGDSSRSLSGSPSFNFPSSPLHHHMGSSSLPSSPSAEFDDESASYFTPLDAEQSQPYPAPTSLGKLLRSKTSVTKRRAGKSGNSNSRVASTTFFKPTLPNVPQSPAATPGLLPAEMNYSPLGNPDLLKPDPIRTDSAAESSGDSAHPSPPSAFYRISSRQNSPVSPGEGLLGGLKRSMASSTESLSGQGRSNGKHVHFRQLKMTPFKQPVS